MKKKTVSCVISLVYDIEGLLFGDKVLANQLLVEHVEEVFKVLLQKLIGKNLVPEIENIPQPLKKRENLRSSSLKVAKASEATSNLGLST